MKGLSGLPANITSVTEQPGFKTLMSLAKSGKVFIKISAFYRSSTSTTPGYDDLEPLVKVFAEISITRRCCAIFASGLSPRSGRA
jgi:predicted TIM-barrel fold metal-dependent hydrolase